MWSAAHFQNSSQSGCLCRGRCSDVNGDPHRLWVQRLTPAVFIHPQDLGGASSVGAASPWVLRSWQWGERRSESGGQPPSQPLGCVGESIVEGARASASALVRVSLGFGWVSQAWGARPRPLTFGATGSVHEQCTYRVSRAFLGHPAAACNGRASPTPLLSESVSDTDVLGWGRQPLHRASRGPKSEQGR